MFHDFIDCTDLDIDAETPNKRIHVNGKGIILHDPHHAAMHTDGDSHSEKKESPTVGHLLQAERQPFGLQISPPLRPLQQNLQMTMLSCQRRVVRETGITESA